MRHQTLKNDSRRKSKMVWLLFAAPLLVPLGWLGRDYYENHKELVVANITDYSTKSSADRVGLYEGFAKVLKNYPNAKKFVVTWGVVEQDPAAYYDCTVKYDRQQGTFDEQCLHPFGADIFVWKNMTDKALYAAAEAEKQKRIAHLTGATFDKLLLLAQPDQKMQENGARPVKRVLN